MPDIPLKLSKADRLRNQAALMRRAASVQTTGGQETNKLLLAAAARMEQQANELDKNPCEDPKLRRQTAAAG